MIIPYKNRVLEVGRTVEVYRNLHTENLFSIRCAETKLVLAHGDNFYVKSAKGFVSQKGREKVINEKKKHVHAWITGWYEGVSNKTIETQKLSLDGVVRYNPYETAEFENLKSNTLYFLEGKVFNA